MAKIVVDKTLESIASLYHIIDESVVDSWKEFPVATICNWLEGPHEEPFDRYIVTTLDAPKYYSGLVDYAPKMEVWLLGVPLFDFSETMRLNRQYNGDILIGAAFEAVMRGNVQLADSIFLSHRSLDITRACFQEIFNSRIF